MLHGRSIMLSLFCKVKTLTAAVAADEEGQALSEYSLTLVLIAVAAIVALALLGTKVSHMLSAVVSGF